MRKKEITKVFEICLPGEIVVWLAVQHTRSKNPTQLAETTRMSYRTVEWALTGLERKRLLG